MSDADPQRLVGADRVVAVLTALAEYPQGISLDELASALGSPKSSVHRALSTLKRAGLAEQSTRGVYVLGDEFIRLAFQHVEGRPETARIQPVLEELATTFGETAHYAILAGRDIVYRAKMDPPQGAVRLTSVVGGRNPAYRTAVGRALLASRLLTRPDLEEALGPFPLDARTPRTLTTAAALQQELEETRVRGFGVDDQESDVGVNCVAFAVHLDGATVPTGAISVSAVTFRCPLDQLIERVSDIRAIITRHLGPAALG